MILSGREAIFQLGLGPSTEKHEAIDYRLLLWRKKVEIIQIHKENLLYFSHILYFPQIYCLNLNSPTKVPMGITLPTGTASFLAYKRFYSILWWLRGHFNAVI